ncbi:hypothetical protein FH972_001639 [Carpinus fangiana]|uniref:LysM domain-containing protein n=1 Tax=Carpinus fangiana TaxID=176857 RepID=A0A5N6QFJ7_9ROSI|nr:hypothetical protein FH972_001639 [Carpinus fangiana]
MKCLSLSIILAAVAHSFATPLHNSLGDELDASLARRDGTGSVTGTAGLSWYDSNLANGNAGRSNPSSYTCFKGPSTNFPARSTWMNFNAMFSLQQKINLQAKDNSTEISNILSSIKSISASAKVDARVILGVIIIEVCLPKNGSSVWPSNSSHSRQSYNPTYKSYDPSKSALSINRMIVDGTQGTAAGPGLVQWFNHASDVSFDTAGNVYKVLRGYNSGALNSSNLSDGEGANDAYVSHIVNYLQGWDGSSGPAHSSSCSFAPPTPTPTKPTACVASKNVPPPTQTVTVGTTSHCCKWYTVKSGDTCYAIDQANGITLAQFRSWNSYVNADCTNIFPNYAYCVSSNDPVTSIASSAPAATSKPTSTIKPSSSSSSIKPAATTTVKSSSTSTIKPSTTVKPAATASTSVKSSATSTVTKAATSAK